MFACSLICFSCAALGFPFFFPLHTQSGCLGGLMAMQRRDVVDVEGAHTLLIGLAELLVRDAEEKDVRSDEGEKRQAVAEKGDRTDAGRMKSIEMASIDAALCLVDKLLVGIQDDCEGGIGDNVTAALEQDDSFALPSPPHDGDAAALSWWVELEKHEKFEGGFLSCHCSRSFEVCGKVGCGNRVNIKDALGSGERTQETSQMCQSCTSTTLLPHSPLCLRANEPTHSSLPRAPETFLPSDIARERALAHARALLLPRCPSALLDHRSKCFSGSDVSKGSDGGGREGPALVVAGLLANWLLALAAADASVMISLCPAVLTTAVPSLAELIEVEELKLGADGDRSSQRAPWRRLAGSPSIRQAQGSAGFLPLPPNGEARQRAARGVDANDLPRHLLLPCSPCSLGLESSSFAYSVGLTDVGPKPCDKIAAKGRKEAAFCAAAAAAMGLVV